MRLSDAKRMRPPLLQAVKFGNSALPNRRTCHWVGLSGVSIRGTIRGGLRRIVDVGQYCVGARSTVGAADSQVVDSDAAMADLLVPDLGSLGAQVVVVLRNHGVVVVIELYFGML